MNNSVTNGPSLSFRDRTTPVCRANTTGSDYRSQRRGLPNPAWAETLESTRPSVSNEFSYKRRRTEQTEVPPIITQRETPADSSAQHATSVHDNFTPNVAEVLVINNYDQIDDHPGRRQMSLTADTVFEQIKRPQAIGPWFQGIYHLTKSQNVVSAMELVRRLGLRYDSDCMLKQRLIQMISERDALTMLSDRVDIDDDCTGGKVGQGAEDKVPFFAAMQTEWLGKLQSRALHKASGFANEQIDGFAKKKLKPTVDFYSDWLACFAALINQGCGHTVTVSGRRKSGENSTFKWVNTSLGKIKFILTGAYPHVPLKYVAPNLAEFQYRFNRRNDLVSSHVVAP